MKKSHRLITSACFSLTITFGAYPCLACGDFNVPPTPDAIRNEVIAMRALMNGMLIEYKTDDVGYLGGTTTIIEKHANMTWESRDGCAVLSTSEFTGSRSSGGRLIASSKACFDGTDTIRVGPMNRTLSLPIVIVKPGLDELFETRGYFNYTTLVWSDLQLPLDELMHSGAYTYSVAPEPIEVRGCQTWCLTLRHNTPDNSEEAATLHEFWVAPSMGMIPLRTRISILLHDGSSRLINGRNAYDFEEVRPGLFLPRSVIITDPFDPNPATYRRFEVIRFGQSRSAAELTADINSGDRYVFDYRYNQQYELRNGVRSNTSNLSSVTELDGKLRKYVAEANAVREASQPISRSTSSWSFGRLAAWSIPGVTGLGFLLWSFRVGRVRA